VRWLFGVLIGSVGIFYAVSIPSHSVRMSYPHDLDLHGFATAAMVPEVNIGFGSLRVGSEFLLYDGRLVTIHP